jgi:hypothetical protein
MAAVQIEQDHLPGPAEGGYSLRCTLCPLGQQRRQRQTDSKETANPQHLAAGNLAVAVKLAAGRNATRDNCHD